MSLDHFDNGSAPPSRKLQFSLLELFVVMTTMTVPFALVGRFGFTGFIERAAGAFCCALPFIGYVGLYYLLRDRV